MNLRPLGAKLRRAFNLPPRTVTFDAWEQRGHLWAAPEGSIPIGDDVDGAPIAANLDGVGKAIDIGKFTDDGHLGRQE